MTTGERTLWLAKEFILLWFDTPKSLLFLVCQPRIGLELKPHLVVVEYPVKGFKYVSSLNEKIG